MGKGFNEEVANTIISSDSGNQGLATPSTELLDLVKVKLNEILFNSANINQGVLTQTLYLYKRSEARWNTDINSYLEVSLSINLYLNNHNTSITFLLDFIKSIYTH